MPSTLPEALALFGVIIGWIVVSLTMAVSHNKFRVELELRHTELWKSLGSPGFTVHRSTVRQKLFGFLWTGRYRQIGDAELTRLGDRARLSTLVAFLCLVGWVTYLLGFAGHR